jgi:hypothetical protein
MTKRSKIFLDNLMSRRGMMGTPSRLAAGEDPPEPPPETEWKAHYDGANLDAVPASISSFQWGAPYTWAFSSLWLRSLDEPVASGPGRTAVPRLYPDADRSSIGFDLSLFEDNIPAGSQDIGVLVRMAYDGNTRGGVRMTMDNNNAETTNANDKHTWEWLHNNNTKTWYQRHYWSGGNRTWDSATACAYGADAEFDPNAKNQYFWIRYKYPDFWFTAWNYDVAWHGKWQEEALDLEANLGADTVPVDWKMYSLLLYTADTLKEQLAAMDVWVYKDYVGTDHGAAGVHDPPTPDYS